MTMDKPSQAAAELEPNPEFEKQLDRAFANPRVADLKGRPTTSPEDLESRTSYFGRFRHVAETMKIRTFESPVFDCDVMTADPLMFELLLVQAYRRMEIARGRGDPGLAATDRIKKTVKHELAHGAMARRFEHGSYYGVSVLHDPNEDEWALSPFHKVAGNEVGEIFLTRLEDAAISLAPEDYSAADLRAAEAAGYSSREEVLAKLS